MKRIAMAMLAGLAGFAPIMLAAQVSDGGGFVEMDGADVFVQEGENGVRLEERPNPDSGTSVLTHDVISAGAAVLRALDKTLGRPTDIEMSLGQAVVFGRIAVRLLDCRYPVDDPASDAFAHIQIVDLEGNELFDGWMIASSPALVALDHPRYDVWVLRCSTS